MNILAQKTLSYWTASYAWNTSSQPRTKILLTVVQGLGLLSEARTGSPRLLRLSDHITDQIVHKQAETPTSYRAEVKQIGG